MSQRCPEIAVVALAVMAGACVDLPSRICGDRLCAADDVCHPIHHCVRPEHITACEGRSAGADCEVANDPGVCRDGVCVQLSCGDGVVNPPEQCDGDDLRGLTCVSMGYEVGSLRCSSSCTLSTVSCDRIGWTEHSGEGATRLWSDGVTVFAIGRGGVNYLFAYDGSVWIEQEVRFPSAVWGTSGGSVWAGTHEGLLTHYDGSEWQDYVTLGGYITALGGSDDSDVYAAYQVPFQPEGTLAHFDGASWSLVHLPFKVGRLSDIWASARRDVYAVGASGAIVHFDGTRWTLQRPGRGGDLLDVWGSGPSDIYALASDELLHFDGRSWSVFPSPIRDSSQQMTAISGSARNDVYLAVQTGDQGSVWRYDGSRWSVLVAPSSPPIRALAADSPTRVWIGRVDRIDQFHGANYVDATGAGAGAIYRAVWGTGPHDYFAAAGTPDSNHTIFHVVDDVWTPAYTTPAIVDQVVGFAADDVYALAQSVLVRFDGARWSEVEDAALAEARVSAIWGNARNDVYACAVTGDDSQGVLFRFDGRAWSRVSPGPPCGSGWSSGPTDVYAISYDQELHHWDGAAWQQVRFGPRSAARAVWGWARNDVYVTDGRRVHHFDGARWSQVARVHFTPSHVVAVARDDVFLIAWTGEAAHFDGRSWSPMKQLTQTPANIQNAWGTPGRLFLPGERDRMATLVRTTHWGCRQAEIECHDGVDDDCDGRIDAVDSDCQSAP